MTKKILALITFVLLTSSCSIYHVNSIDKTDDYYPPKSVDEVFYRENIDQPFTLIGIVTVNGERRQRGIDDIVRKMKREAAIIGGNAITDIRTDATGAWKQLPVQQTIGNAYVRSNFTASVVLLENPATEDSRSFAVTPQEAVDEGAEPVAEDPEPATEETFTQGPGSL